jgi:gluconolactonase
MVTVIPDAGLSELIASDSLERLADGFQFTEVPLWCADGSLLFQDIKAERTFVLRPDRTVHVLRDSKGAANGQAFSHNGRFVFCEQNGRRISVMDRHGDRVETVDETWSGARLNSPNDIVARSDGVLCFTDPPYCVEPGHRPPFPGGPRSGG